MHFSNNEINEGAPTANPPETAKKPFPYHLIPKNFFTKI